MQYAIVSDSYDEFPNSEKYIFKTAPQPLGNIKMSSRTEKAKIDYNKLLNTEFTMTKIFIS